MIFVLKFNSKSFLRQRLGSLFNFYSVNHMSSLYTCFEKNLYLVKNQSKIIIHDVVSLSHTWMPCPDSDDVTIPGLAYIYPLEQLIVAERKDVLHDVIGRNGIPYTIFNSVGQKVFLAVLTKRFKKFDVKIFNNYGNEIINVQRPFSLLTNKVLVWAPPGNFVGSVHEGFQIVSSYTVKNQTGRKVLQVRSGRMCQYVYKIYVWGGGHAIGLVSNHIPVAAMLDVKHFGVSFPKELDVKDKAVLLGACFLIGWLKY